MEVKLPNIASFCQEAINKAETLSKVAEDGILGNFHEKVLKMLTNKNPLELLTALTAIGNGDTSKLDEINKLGEEMFESCPDLIKEELNNVIASLPKNPVEAIEALQSDADGGLSSKIEGLMEVLNAV